MVLPQQFMDELRRRTQLSGIIGKHVKLSRAGSRLRGLCPFHQEKTPSFYVNDSEGFYKCFGCGVGGDAISFLREKEGLEFMEAVRRLADLAGMQVPAQAPADPEAKAKRDKSQAVLEDTMRYFQSCLAQAKGGVADYLKTRALDKETIETFALGYAPEKGLIEHLTKLNHTNEAMIEAGVARLSERDNSIYPYFRNRLMFPIMDRSGKVIAFGGRALAEGQNPKYINSAETPLFKKSAVLYGAHLARAKLKEGLPLLVTEGYMDAIAVNASGCAVAVAPLGTALSEDQISQLWQMTDVPILSFDGDAAGKAAALRVILRALPILKSGKSIRLMLLPQGSDPDDIIRQQGTETFTKLLGETVGLSDSLWNGLAEQHEVQGEGIKDTAKRTKFFTEIRECVKTIKNGAVRSALGDEIEGRIRAERDGIRGFSPQAVGFFHRGPLPKTKPDQRAKLILAILMEYPQLIVEYSEKLAMLAFRNSAMDKCRKVILGAVAQEQNLEKETLHDYLTECGFGNIKADALLKDTNYKYEDLISLLIDEAEERLLELLYMESITPRKRSPSPMERTGVNVDASASPAQSD